MEVIDIRAGPKIVFFHSARSALVSSLSAAERGSNGSHDLFGVARVQYCGVFVRTRRPRKDVHRVQLAPAIQKLASKWSEMETYELQDGSTVQGPPH